CTTGAEGLHERATRAWKPRLPRRGGGRHLRRLPRCGWKGITGRSGFDEWEVALERRKLAGPRDDNQEWRGSAEGPSRRHAADGRCRPFASRPGRRFRLRLGARPSNPVKTSIGGKVA